MYDVVVPAAAAASGVPIGWVLTAIGGTALTMVGAMKLLWMSKERSELARADSQKELVEAHKARALSAETARIAADQARAIAETARVRAEDRYDYMSAQFKGTTVALRQLRREDEASRGAPLSIAPPRNVEEEPTLRFYVDAQADREYAEQLERERSEAYRHNPLRVPGVPKDLPFDGPRKNQAETRGLPFQGSHHRTGGSTDYDERRRRQAREGKDTPTEINFDGLGPPMGERK